MASDPTVTERLIAALADRYAIEREIGSGGMATVYLAQDLKHDRKVAVKVLRPELAAVLGAERFLSEIKVTANLQHPHILPLHDSGEAKGFLYYVMPFVEGESLRAKLDREKQLSVDEAVAIASAVAKALDYAHRHGVIHRDIKPANILLHDGQPMVADFGIALAVRAAGGERLTETGLSLGTPQYMSPEQASGDREVDGRSDVYSLGAMLYEMLTGEPPHSGPTVQAIIAKLLTDKPRPVTELRETVPVHVAATVHKALAKLPADRFGGAGEFVEAVTGKVATSALAPGRETRVPDSASTPPLRILPWALVVILASVSVFLAVKGGSPGADRVGRFNLMLEDSVPLAFIGEAWGGMGQPAMALSPDGRSVAYVGKTDTTTQLFVRSLEDFETRALAGTEGAVDPFFSPDGAWIGFTRRGRLLRVSADGASVQRITEAYSAYGCSWSDQNQIACVTRDSHSLLVTDPNGTNVCIVSPNTMEIRRVMTSGEAGSPEGIRLGGSNPRYVDGGYLVYSHGEENVVLGIRFDPERLETLSEPVELFRGVRREGMHGALQMDVSRSGDMVYAPGMGAIQGRLVWAGPDGSRDTLHAFPPGLYGAFRLSPDGRRLMIRETSDVGQTNLWFLDLERGESIPWVQDPSTPGTTSLLAWLPDSERALLSRSEGDTTVLFLTDPRRGSGENELRRGHGDPTPVQVTPDGRVLFLAQGGEGSYLAQASLEDLKSLPADAEQAFPPIMDSPGLLAFPSYSPDGRWLLFASDYQGPREAYAQRVGSDDPPIKLSRGEGDIPRSTPAGDAIYFRDRQRFYRVEVTGDPPNSFSEPELYLEGDFLNVPGSELEVHPDGRRLLLLEGPGEQTTTRLNFIQNWRRILEARLGG
jgi:Tol biopolymer transport system component/tRNA A-37 threonylcarbamoyl transferase component Bud32